MLCLVNSYFVILIPRCMKDVWRHTHYMLMLVASVIYICTHFPLHPLLLLLCFFLHFLTSAKSYHSTTPLCFALRDLHVWQLPDYFPILMDLNWWRHRGLNHPISLSPDARDLGRNIRRCWCLIPEQTLGSRAIFVPSWLSMWWLWTYPPFTAGSANHFWELLKSVTKKIGFLVPVVSDQASGPGFLSWHLFATALHSSMAPIFW